MIGAVVFFGGFVVVPGVAVWVMCQPDDYGDWPRNEAPPVGSSTPRVLGVSHTCQAGTSCTMDNLCQ